MDKDQYSNILDLDLNETIYSTEITNALINHPSVSNPSVSNPSYNNEPVSLVSNIPSTSTAAQHYSSVLNPSYNNEPESLVSNIPSTSTAAQHYSLTQLSDSQLRLFDLLKAWNLEEMFPKCVELDMDIISLEQLGDYKQIFLNNFSLGKQVKFNCKYNEWISTRSTTPTTISNNSEPLDLFALVERSDNKDNLINIRNILKESVDGEYILKYYNSSNNLCDALRSMLTDIIINYIIKQNIKMTVTLANNIAERIISEFPTESKVLYYYKEGGKAPAGKIYAKYYNKLQKLKKVGIIASKPNQTQSDTTLNTSTVIQEEECQESLSALAADNCTWAELENHWLNTAGTRLNFIKTAETTDQIMAKWPHYKKPLGYKLIEIDFKKLYQTTSIETSFAAFLEKIIPLLDEKVKGSEDRNLLAVLKCKENFNENGQAAILFYLIHHILQPTSRKVQVENNKKIHIRFSIQDAQQTFILVGQTPEALEEKLKIQLDKQQSVQPLLLVTGTLSNPTQIMIYFDGIKYKIFSILRGIDILVSIFHLFNLKYPLQSLLVWMFIQNYFYKIKTKYDISNVAIKYLIERLEK